VSKIAAAVLAFVCLTLFSLPVSAQLIPHGNVYVGASYGKSDFVINRYSFRGWNASAEAIPLQRFSHLGLVIDTSGLYRSGITEYNFLGGARVAYSFGRWRPFVHVLGGIQRFSSAGNKYQSPVADFGGGADYKLFFKNFSWRFQGDYMRTRLLSAAESDFRASTGLVWRF